MSVALDLIGEIYGRLKVIKLDVSKTENNGKSRKRRYWVCECSCGKTKTINQDDLRSKNTTSCGCYQAEQIKKANKNRIIVHKDEDNPMLLTARKVHSKRYIECPFEIFIKISQMDCDYCGKAPSNSCNLYKNKEDGSITEGIRKEWADLITFEYNGADRIDSTLGHTPDNLVPCCITCNMMKSKMTTSEFYNWLNLVKNNFINNGCQMPTQEFYDKIKKEVEMIKEKRLKKKFSINLTS